MKILKIKNKYKKGFGLLEVLISSVIIIIILSALVIIGRAALNNNEYLAQRAQAIYLAQEGLEMTRQIRDTNWIDGVNTTKWDLSDGTNVTTDDYKPYYNSASARMLLAINADGEDISIPVVAPNVTFNRKINVAPANNNLLPNPTVAGSPNLSAYAIKVKSIVTWSFSGQDRTIELSEILTNWRPDF